MMKLRHAAFIILAVLVSGSSSVRAMDDGGTRSVFARGAGDRALALGGAFGAVDDDPAAIIWNPAGLAGLQRTSIYATNTNLIGLGFSERFGTLALPSWRLGTFGLGVRRFGVDGIEGRDDRGGLLDENFKDAETEISLAYARQLGRAWKFGFTTKFQQQELAGYKDSGFGVDAGVMVRPLVAMGGSSAAAERLNLGLSIRNLIEPTLRLDIDDVPDPLGVRLGGAYRTDPAADLGLMAVVDVEKTRMMDSRLHAGLELWLLGALALRGGSNDGMLTAGAGLRTGGFAVDYAFEDNPIDPVHRIGLGLAFGRTTAENRLRAQAELEEALQDRLAEAFSREDKSRNDGLMEAIRRALRDGDPDQALNLAGSLRVLSPDYRDLDLVEAAAHLQVGRRLEQQGDLPGAALAYQRALNLDPSDQKTAERLRAVRSRSDDLEARSSEIRRMLDRALAAYAAGGLLEAREGFEAILALNPADRETRALLESTRQTIALQAGTLADQARALAQAGNPGEARKVLDRALALDPGLPGAAEVERLIAQAGRPAVAEAASPAARSAAKDVQEQGVSQPAQQRQPSFEALSAKRQAEIARLYKEGLTAMEEGRRQDALGYWELVWSAAPDYLQVAENLKQEYLVQGLEAFAAGRLDRSIEIWERALEVAPGDARTRGYLTRAYEHRAKIREIRGGE